MKLSRVSVVFVGIVIPISVFVLAENTAIAQSQPQSICNLPQLAPGTHKSIRIAAVAESGTDMGVLTDYDCPSLQHLWFELLLKSESNRSKLHDQIEASGKAAVVISGELYGPPLPDPKLPEAIRNNLRQGWGHLGAFPLKVVVFHIESVKPVRKSNSSR